MEKIYTIKEHTTTERQVTKDQYISHLQSKIDYAVELLMDATLKVDKAKAEQGQKKKKVELLTAELESIAGKDNARKSVDYSIWRFTEMYPKKAAKLKESDA
jgi:hypothetical protein